MKLFEVAGQRLVNDATQRLVDNLSDEGWDVWTEFVLPSPYEDIRTDIYAVRGKKTRIYEITLGTPNAEESAKVTKLRQVAAENDWEFMIHRVPNPTASPHELGEIKQMFEELKSLQEAAATLAPNQAAKRGLNSYRLILSAGIVETLLQVNANVVTASFDNTLNAARRLVDKSLLSDQAFAGLVWLVKSRNVLVHASGELHLSDADIDRATNVATAIREAVANQAND